jgi:exodeoxyribonuclease V alpha subunit
VRFKTAFLRIAPPTTRKGVERYLGSRLIKDEGPVYAKTLGDAFGPRRAERIVGPWEDQRVIRDIALSLPRRGVGISRTTVRR